MYYQRQQEHHPYQQKVCGNLWVLPLEHWLLWFTHHLQYSLWNKEWMWMTWSFFVTFRMLNQIWKQVRWFIRGFINLLDVFIMFSNATIFIKFHLATHHQKRKMMKERVIGGTHHHWIRNCKQRQRDGFIYHQARHHCQFQTLFQTSHQRPNDTVVTQNQ